MQITPKIQQQMNFEDNNQAIQYYQYLRETMEVGELAYWIGNPSVEIISGKILLEPMQPIKSDKEPQNYELYLKEILKTNKCYKKGQEQETQNDKQIKQQQKVPQVKQKQQIECLDKQANVQSLPDERKESMQNNEQSRCLILCGIPNSKSPVEVMETECISRMSQLINEIRVIKTVHIRYYGMLLLMKDYKSSCEFFNQLFGEEYTCLEMERIIIRRIRSITLSFSQLTVQGTSNQMNLLRQINQNSQYIQPQNIFMTYHHQKIKSQSVESQNNNQNYPQLVCAICFDQCNQQTISILCGHYFDLYCLQKWSENICPLCRYHQQPPIIKFCQKCNQCEGLWVCLICGSRLCCGVNHDILAEDSHIYDHYKNTSHSLSMDLETKFLFDAKIPAFLHQKFYKDLILSDSTENKMGQGQNDQCSKKDKITQQIQQYEAQVTQQMKNQRLYFEEQINKRLKQQRSILTKKRQTVHHLQSQIAKVDNQQAQITKQIMQIQASYEKNLKQLQIIQNLIKMKEQKVQQKREQIKKNKNIKLMKLKQLDDQIREKKEEILNYRKNLLLKQKLTEKLKGEQVQGEFVLLNQDKPKRKKKNK